MKAQIRFLTLLLGFLFFLAAGEQARASAFGPPSADNVKIELSSDSIGTNSTATLTVTVTRRNGSPETDGTLVSATASPSTIGTVAGVGASGTVSGSSSPLVGGIASFVFIAGNSPGSATITVSVPPVNGHPNTIISHVTINVTPGGTGNPSLQISPASASLPQNILDVGPALGSPFLGEIQVQWRGLITGQLLNGKVNVAISPVEVASFSTLDDPTTPWVGQTKTPPTAEGNEFLTLLGSGTVNVMAGVGTIFVHAGSTPGKATLTVTATDPETNRTISSQFALTVVGAGDGLPTAVTLSQSDGGVYINGSNGPQSKLLTARVSDASSTPVNNPSGGAHNVHFEIVGPDGNDATLRTFDSWGNPVSGKAVNVATVKGIANVSFLAGSRQGPVQVKATVDGSDGNVDNGIDNPVSAAASVIVSDGQLYSLTITSPYVNAIAVNGITVSSSGGGSGGGGTTHPIPTWPDATYSLTVSAIATDREGNPVLPGTQIRFGLIDTPQDPNYGNTCPGLGAFQICGYQGNPAVGQMYFSAPDGRFRSAGGGAGPGDTLVVFGKQWHGAPAGNDDLESALSISGVVDDTRLFTIFPFNANDTTGAPVASGPVLPYVIGRATIGNINSPASTDSSGAATITGTATTKLNFPVSHLNRNVVIYAQGTGPDTVTGGTRIVTDAVVSVYPGVADLIVSATPNPLPGNLSVAETVCVVDALSVPMPGVALHFGFSDLGVGSGTVDGIAAAGWTQEITNASGCLVAQVSTQGIAGSSGSGGGGSSGTPTLTFSAPGYGSGGAGSVSIPITAGGDLILLATPSGLPGGGGNVTLTLLSSNGKPVQGAQLSGSCTGDTVGLTSGPGTTDGNGRTSASIGASLDAYGKVNKGSCTFTTATGSPTATVNLTGADLCVGDPTNPACSGSGGGGGTGNKLTLTMITGSNTTGATITMSGGGAIFSPSSNICRVANASDIATCTWTFSGAVSAVVLKSTLGGSPVWSAGCTGSGPNIAVPISGAATCTATYP